MEIEINFVRKKSRILLRMTGALQRSSLEKFGSSQFIRRESSTMVSNLCEPRVEEILAAENSGFRES